VPLRLCFEQTQAQEHPLSYLKLKKRVTLLEVSPEKRQVSNAHGSATRTTTNPAQFRPKPMSLQTMPLAFHSNHPTVHSKLETMCLPRATLAQYTLALLQNFVDLETNLRYPIQKESKIPIGKNSNS
jgi:hypothetical protein